MQMNMKDNATGTPLLIATARNDVEMVRLLIPHIIDINYKNKV